MKAKKCGRQKMIDAIPKMSKKELIDTWRDYTFLIRIEECFGSFDVTYLDCLAMEIEKRNYKDYDDLELMEEDLIREHDEKMADK